MSGHSHWKTIKYKKGVADAKRGALFSKISRLITVAAKEGGDDPTTNARLRLAIEHARSFNMPKENIERALERARGIAPGAALEETLIEAYGPAGIALLIEIITDNKNRTLGEIRQILSKYGGKLGDKGSVQWLFEQAGVIRILGEQNESLSQQDIELGAVELGAEDLRSHDGGVDVIVPPNMLETVRNALQERGVVVDSATLMWLPKNIVHLSDGEKDILQKLFDELDELDSVQGVYSNTP